MATRELEVRFTADTKDLSRGSKQAADDIDQVGKSADRSSKEAGRGFSGMRSALAGFAGGAAAELAGRGLDAVVEFGKASITAASDMQETLSKSRTIFGKQAGDVERWANSAATNFGLAKSEALDYAAGLGDMASQIGFTGKQSAAFGQDLVQVAADLGSFNNLETGDVLDKISGALRGEYDSLQAIIPNINAARVEQEALTLTGKKAAKELTAQDKALAVQAILHKDGARAMGDFAKTSGGFANQQKIAAAQVQTLQERLGQMLLPILTTVMGFITTTAIPALMEFATWFSDNLAPQIEAFGRQLSGLLPVIQAFAGFLAQNADWLLPLAGAIAAIVAAIRIWTGVQAALNLVMSANPIGIVVIAIGALVAGLIYAYQNSETFRNVVNGAFTAVKNVVLTVGNAIVGAVKAIGDWLVTTWQAAVDFGVRVVRAFHEVNARVTKFVADLVATVTGWWTSMVAAGARLVTNLRDRFIRANQQLRDGVVKAVTQLRDGVVRFVTSARDRALSLAANLRDKATALIRGLRDGAVRGITQLRDGVVSRFTSLRDRGYSLIVGFRDRVTGAFRSVRDGANTIIARARQYVVDRFVQIRDTVGRVASSAKDRALAPFRALRDAAGGIFRALRDSVGKSMNGLLDRIKSPLRAAFSWLNRNLIGPLNSVTTKFGLRIPDLPRFHRGTSRVGRGQGEVPAVLLANEAVLNPRAAARLGRGTIDRLNRGEGFGGPGDWWNNFTEFISRPAQLLAKMAEKGVKWAIGQVLGAIPNLPDTGVPFVDGISRVLNSMKSGALSWAGKRQAEQTAELGSNGGGSIGSGPWVKPVAGHIGNGYLGYPGHYGVDFPVGTGTNVHAVSNAIVSKAASLTYSYGRHLFLRHADGLVTVYAHLSQLLASAGQRVSTGQVIGRSGSTGNSTGPHLHFETRVGGGYPGPNPRSVMAARGVTLDSGGMLQPGLTLVRNATGGPEPVLTSGQWAALTKAKDAPTVVINVNGALDPVAVARQIRRILGDDMSRIRGVNTRVSTNG